MSNDINQDNAEKAVKLMVENHRLMLTLVGLFIAGLFAYAGRVCNQLDWRYFLAQAAFVLAGILIVLSVSVAIGHARSGKYDVRDPWMSWPYGIALLLITLGLAATGYLLVSPPPPGLSSSSASSGIRIDGRAITIAPDTRLKVKADFNQTTKEIQSIEVSPP